MPNVLMQVIDEELIEELLPCGSARRDVFQIEEDTTGGKQFIDLGVERPLSLIRLMMNAKPETIMSKGWYVATASTHCGDAKSA